MGDVCIVNLYPLQECCPGKPWQTVSPLLVAIVVLVGCSRGLSPEYGASKGTTGKSGINGFGALRQSFEANGWKTRDIGRLSNRLDSLDAIVWIPTTHQAYESPAIMWLHDWLGDRPRTLIYILPDEGNEDRYWETARDAAPPDQRLEYRRRHARAISDVLNGPYGHVNQQVDEVDRFWFKAKIRRDPRPRWEILPQVTKSSTNTQQPSLPKVVVNYFSTDWAEEGYELADGDLTIQPLVSDVEGNPLAVRIVSTRNSDTQSHTDTETAAVTESESADNDVATMDDDYEYMKEWMDPIEWQRMQRRQIDGFAIGDSQIIVVAGGSMVTNFGMVTDQGAELAKRLLAETIRKNESSPPRVGFITSGVSGVPVSDASDRPEMVVGMQLFTVWPLSIVTFHLAVMGIIACLILLPIFGRPRKLKEKSNSDFADHINAVALLLQRSGGEHYARQRISEYFRRVRGETAGPWVMPLPITTTPATKPSTEDSDTASDPAPEPRKDSDES